MRPVVVKLLALLAVFLVLLACIGQVRSLVQQRQHSYEQAVESIAHGTAQAQTVLGPLIVRSCTERWYVDEEDSSGKTRRSQRLQEVVEVTSPSQLDATAGQLHVQKLHRGLFSAQIFTLHTTLKARFDAEAATHAGGGGSRPAASGRQRQCQEPRLVVAVGDARGIRTAQLRINQQPTPVQAGTGLERYARGVQAALGTIARSSALPLLDVELELELMGTGSLGIVPIGDSNHIALQGNWPHPAFSGHFLPGQRRVGADGFEASWRISALASNALPEMAAGAALCPLHAYRADVIKGYASPEAADDSEAIHAAAMAAHAAATEAAGEAAPTSVAGQRVRVMHPQQRGEGCMQMLGVRLMDPVNPYTLSDRASKYALLFVVLTFIATVMVEVLRQLCVHPVQYLLVGAALVMFFLLLLSLSEHLPFVQAYALATSACVLLLAYYAAHILHGWRRGAGFGAGMALLYGLLYVLLQMEQNALLVGSLVLFGVLAVVMVLTRRVDWYAISQRHSSPLRQTAPAGMPPLPARAQPHQPVQQAPVQQAHQDQQDGK